MPKRTICVSAQLEEDLAAKLVEVADKVRCSKSRIIRDALVDYFNKFDIQQRSEERMAPIKRLVETAMQTRTPKAMADARKAINDFIENMRSERQTQTKPVLDQQEIARPLNESAEEGEVTQKRERTRKG
jgi:metal-responsive CopG/Arc/MetJ family transcriptional regulator